MHANENEGLKQHQQHFTQNSYTLTIHFALGRIITKQFRDPKTHLTLDLQATNMYDTVLVAQNNKLVIYIGDRTSGIT